jgi:3-hydroxyacyl-[acyl-carrier-protein] dehydratase
VPQKLLRDISALNLDHVEYPIEEIRKINPHRHEFEQLTAVLLFRPEEKLAVGLREVREDEFWVRGHIPGRPILPGVLMLESAAQLCSFYSAKVTGIRDLLGFAGVDDARFREQIRPGQRLLIVAVSNVLTASRCHFQTQGLVDGKIAFDATILGVRLRPGPSGGDRPGNLLL